MNFKDTGTVPQAYYQPDTPDSYILQLQCYISVVGTLGSCDMYIQLAGEVGTVHPRAGVEGIPYHTARVGEVKQVATTPDWCGTCVSRPVPQSLDFLQLLQILLPNLLPTDITMRCKCISIFSQLLCLFPISEVAGQREKSTPFHLHKFSSLSLLPVRILQGKNKKENSFLEMWSKMQDLSFKKSKQSLPTGNHSKVDNVDKQLDYNNCLKNIDVDGDMALARWV